MSRRALWETAAFKPESNALSDTSLEISSKPNCYRKKQSKQQEKF
jgi:hypothetical protein